MPNFEKGALRQLLKPDVMAAIQKNNEVEWDMADALMTFTQNALMPGIAAIPPEDNEQALVQKAILLLLTQGAKSYQGSLILAQSGNYTTSVIVIRNIIETIFNISFIWEDAEEEYLKAHNYVYNISRWTDDTIRDKAYLSFNSNLYALYRLTSDYTHSNYIATSQNMNEDGHILFFPNDNKISFSLSLANSVYYYLIELLCLHYDIDNLTLRLTKRTAAFQSRYDSFKLFNFAKRYYDE